MEHDDKIISEAVSMARGGKRKSKVHKGPIHSSVAGRTDHLPIHVASGSYVIPADIISAMGEGNSMAGFKVAKSIFSFDGPYDRGSAPYGAKGLPYGMPAPRRATGGKTSAPAGNPVASARAAAGDQRVIANREASARYASQEAQRSGAPIPGHLQSYAKASGAPAGGGLGASGPTFKGGPFSGAMNSLGITPYGSNTGNGAGRQPSGVTPYSSNTGNGAERQPRGIFAMKGLGDLSDGGGLGTSGPEFKGGPFSSILNALGITPAPQGRASGGRAEDENAVPIVAAGGEYVIPPEDVERIGKGSLDDGHKILDAFVLRMRKKTIKTLKSLPGPKKD